LPGARLLGFRAYGIMKLKTNIGKVVYMPVVFKMWTPFHYFMIVFPFILAVVLHLGTRNSSDRVKKNTVVILSILMIGILVMRNVYIWVNKGSLNPEVIPFQVCHFANFMFLIAVLSPNKVWGTIAWCLNFPAGLVSVIFADGLMNYPTMLNIQAIAYVAGHMLIVATGMYMLLARTIRITWKSMGQMFLLVGAGYLLSVVINNWFNKLFASTKVTANYFYTFKPEVGTPLEAMYNLGEKVTVLGITFNPVYLAVLGFVGAVLLLAMYGIYRLREATATKNSKSEFGPSFMVN